MKNQSVKLLREVILGPGRGLHSTDDFQKFTKNFHVYIYMSSKNSMKI